MHCMQTAPENELEDLSLFRVFLAWGPGLVELIGIEPTTSGLQSPRSPS